MPNQLICRIINKLSAIEYRLAFGSNQKLELAALIGTFQIARNSI